MQADNTDGNSPVDPNGIFGPADSPSPESPLENVPADSESDLLSAARGLLDGDWDAGRPIIENYLVPACVALLFLLVAYFAAGMISRAFSQPIRKKVDETLGRFIGKLIFYAIFIMAFLGVLGQFGVSVTSFAAVLAAAGFAIGLAFQGTLSNFAAGVLLMAFRPFKVGDAVNIAGVTGKVFEIDLFTTALDTPDNRRIIIPNSSITGTTIENVTYHAYRRVDVAVGVDYSSSLDSTRAALTAAAESQRELLAEGEGRGYQIVLTDLGDSAVLWAVKFWVNSADFWTLREGLIGAIKNQLDQDGIGIPYPQLDVHVLRSE
jgi:small conductance mechanosensitive channel